MYTTKLFNLQDNYKDAFSIRKKVFMDEQGFKDEFDDIDNIAWHIVIYDEDKPIATGRLFTQEKDIYIIGRICVLKEYRKNKVGKIIMEKLEEKAKELCAKKIELSAQCQAKGFYESVGYKPVGDVYFDEHCEHIKMIKEL